MIISLTGFMGCGKSSVGRKLSELLCCPFMDLDDEIVEREGRSIPEIFATDGEATFRRMEKEALLDILEGRETRECQTGVLALGGGTVMTKECAELVHENTLCIYLRALADTLLSHLTAEADGRPMLNHGDKSDSTVSQEEVLRRRIEDLMTKRSAAYEKTSHVIIDTDGKSIDSIAQEIRQVLRDREGL